MIEELTVAITTTGGAGVSAGNGTTPSVRGKLLALYIAASVSVAATTDWTFTDPVTNVALLTLTNSTTTGFIAPALALVGVTGSGITNSHREIPIVNGIKCAIAQADDGVYTVHYYIER